MNYKKEYIIFSSVQRDALVARPQNLALSLSANNKVLYVDLFKGIKAILSDLDFIRKPKFFVAGDLIKKSDNYYAYCPPNYGLSYIPIRFSHNLFTLALDTFHRQLYSFYLKNILKNNNFNADYRIVLYETPLYQYMMRSLEEDIVIYDCIDEVAEFRMIPGSYIDYAEEYISRNSDMIIATSDILMEKCKSYKKPLYKITNALADIFINPTGLSDIPDDIKSIPHPRIGFIGYVGEWFDLDIMEYCILNMRDFHFVFTGMVKLPDENDQERFKKLISLDNVHYLGFKEFKDIPVYVNEFDVCLMPFKINKFVRAINPVKIYEYFMMGKPVVSTYWEELDYFENLALFGNNNQVFAEKIREALKSDNPELKQRRKEFALKNTWNHRASAIDNSVDEYIENFLIKK